MAYRMTTERQLRKRSGLSPRQWRRQKKAMRRTFPETRARRDRRLHLVPRGWTAAEHRRYLCRSLLAPSAFFVQATGFYEP